MRIICLLSLFLLTFSAFAQKFSGESLASSFQIIKDGSLNDHAVSAPVQFEIPVKEELHFVKIDISANASEPVLFNIGQTALTSTNASVSFQEQKPLNSSLQDIEKSHPLFYSLIVGINDYTHNNEKLHDLTNAVHDANTLRTTLTENFYFPNEYTYLLENPTRQEIIQQLEVLAAKITPKDNLLIFYAGHGIWDPRIKVGYWLPADAKTNDKSSWIANSTIRDYVAGINSKHTLLITDACFSGSILKSRELNLSDAGMANLYRLQSRKAMTSGTLSSVPDDSKFMYYFLKRLLDTESKYISARQLFYSLETAVLNNSATVPQFGVIQDTGDEGGDFIFIRK